MGVKLVSSKHVIQRHKLHWTVNIGVGNENLPVGFPDEIPGHFSGHFIIKRGVMGVMGDGFVMNPVGDVGDEKVKVSMTWSPPEDEKLRMICGLSIGKTAALQDVNLDDKNSYKVKLKFGGFLSLGKCDDGVNLLYGGKSFDDEYILLKGNNIFKDLIVDNKFSVKAEIMILPRTANREFSQASSTLTFLGNMRSIEMGDKNCDLKIFCQDKEFSVHKVIICGRCEVFKNAFENESLESSSNVYTMKDTTAEACEEMLKFIYKGVPGDISKCVDDLLQLSDMYQLKELKAACLDSLMDNLKISNCILTYVNVNRFAAESRIKKDILMFINCKVMKVIEEENWDLFLKQYPALATDIVKSIGKEKKFKHSCQFC